MGVELSTGGADCRVRQRWSAKRKAEVVLRLLRGEDIESVSKEVNVPAFVLSRWREEFLEAGTEGLRKKPRTETEKALRAAQAKVGELAMKVEILQELLRKRGLHLTPLRPGKSPQEGDGR